MKILLDAERILADLEAADKEAADRGVPALPLSAWHPEFGSWMVEGEFGRHSEGGWCLGDPVPAVVFSVCVCVLWFLPLPFLSP